MCNVDAKGRFAIPTKYRAMLHEMCAGACVMTIDTDDACLLLYPLPTWEAIETQLQSLPSLNPKVRRIQRLLIGHASECELDGQGRLLLSSILKDHAALGKKLMLVGQGKKFELWSEDNWLAKREDWLQAGKADTEGVPDELSSISV